MQRQECSECGCGKSMHHKYNGGNIICDGCWEIFSDNQSEYYNNNMNAWHTFKLDNLKYLEQCYESRNQ